MKFTFMLAIWMLSSVIANAQGSIHSLAEVEQLALQRDFILKSIAGQKQAQIESSQAALSWEDPAVKFGVNNLPLDSFSFDQEAMTQIKLGIVQNLPQGDSLAIQSRRYEFAAREKDYDAWIRIRQILKALRLSWLEILYQEQAHALLRNNYRLFEESRDLIELNYASGRADQQDIYQMELELSLLDDKLQDNRMQTQVAVDALERWTGVRLDSKIVAADSSLLHSALLMESEQQQLRLRNHPGLLKITQIKEQSKQDIKLSQQKYKPIWAIDVSYGKRLGDNPDGSSRSDFFSTMLKMKYPLWGKHRQDHLLAASEQKMLAVNFDYDDRLIELQRDLSQTNGQIQRLLKRIHHYDETILNKAGQNAQAALNAYQAGVGKFNEVVRSNVTRLNIELAQLKLKVDLARQYVNLAYLLGDE